MFGCIGTMGLLLGSSIYDIRWKKVPVTILSMGAIWAFIEMVINIVNQGFLKAFLLFLIAIVPGAGLMVLAYLTERKIGFGDGIILMLIGALEGIGKVLLIFCVGLFLQSLFAVVLVMIGKADKQTRIPFVPFLLAARIILFIC